MLPTLQNGFAFQYFAQKVSDIGLTACAATKNPDPRRESGFDFYEF